MLELEASRDLFNNRLRYLLRRAKALSGGLNKGTPGGGGFGGGTIYRALTVMGFFFTLNHLLYLRTASV